MKETGLVKYDSMYRAIVEAAAVDEVKGMRDQAMAIERYAQQALNMDAELKAREIRLRAERKLGVLLKEQKENGNRDAGRGGDRKSQSRDTTVKTLAEVGISRDQSSKFQKLAEIPEAEFEEALADPDQKPTTASLIRKLSGDGGKVHPQANYVNGQLREYEEGRLQLEPAQVVRELTPTMAARIRRSALAYARYFEELHQEVEDAGFTDKQAS